MSLTRNTISDRITDFAADIDGQLKEKVAFSVAIDESTDNTGFSSVEYASLTFKEEFVQLVPTTRTTEAEDIFGSLVGALDNCRVN